MRSWGTKREINRTYRRESLGLSHGSSGHNLEEAWAGWDPDNEGLYDESVGPESMVIHPMVQTPEVGTVSGTSRLTIHG